MSTTITVDNNLISEAMKLTGIQTARDLIHEALTRLIRIEHQKDVLKLEGRINWIGKLDEMRESRFIEDDFSLSVDNLNRSKKA